MSSEAKKTILVVEDENDLVAFLRMLLEDQGYGTISAADGDEGLELIRAEKPDLVTLDLAMPRHSGIRLYRELKGDKDTAEIPVVIVTGVPGELKRLLEERKLVHNPDAYFEKPIDQEEFLSTIERLLKDS